MTNYSQLQYDDSLINALAQQNLLNQQQESMVNAMNQNYGAVGDVGVIAKALMGARQGYLRGKQNEQDKLVNQEYMRVQQEIAQQAQANEQLKAQQEQARKQAEIAQNYENLRPLLNNDALARAVATGQIPLKDAMPKQAQPTPAMIEAQKFFANDPQRQQEYVTGARNKPGQTFNLGPKATPFQTKLADKKATQFVDWEEKAIASNETLANMQKMKEIAQLQSTGKIQEATALITQYFGSEAGANMQAFNAIQKKMMLDAASTLSGAMSDGEWEVLGAQLPGFGNDPRANQIIMGIIESAADRTIERYEDASNYIEQNGRLRGFKPKFAFSSKNRSFQKDSQPQSQYPDGTVIENAQGQRMIMKNGQWVSQ